METPIIKDVEALRQHIQAVDPEHEVVDDDRLFWFVSIQEARSLSDASIKDIASMFRDGMDPINTLERVQEYIDTYFEGYTDEETIMEQNGFIINAVYDFLGVDQP